ISLRPFFSSSLSARARVLQSTSWRTRLGYWDQKAKAIYPPIETPAREHVSTFSLSNNWFRSAAISPIVHGDGGSDRPKPRRSGAITRNLADRAGICASHIA